MSSPHPLPVSTSTLVKHQLQTACLEKRQREAGTDKETDSQESEGREHRGRRWVTTGAAARQGAWSLEVRRGPGTVLAKAACRYWRKADLGPMGEVMEESLWPPSLREARPGGWRGRALC